jgi:hypothetical protein
MEDTAAPTQETIFLIERYWPGSRFFARRAIHAGLPEAIALASPRTRPSP